MGRSMTVHPTESLFGRHQFQPRNPSFERDVRDMFGAQPAMALIGAELTAVQAGSVEITLDARADLMQQHGVLHGGVVGMVLDSAAAFAIATLLPAGGTGFTAGYDVKFLSPANGPLVAHGEVLRVGRTIAMSMATAHVIDPDTDDVTLVACASEIASHFSTISST